jgi:hypothetical protein
MVAAGRGSGASSSSSSAVGGGREGGAAGGKGTLNIDVLRNAGYSESEIKAEVARALADGKEIVGGPAPKPKEPTPTSTPAAAATAAKEKEPWDERFAKVGANLNRGVGLFANPGAFVNILMAVVLVLFIWIVLKVFFPMV